MKANGSLYVLFSDQPADGREVGETLQTISDLIEDGLVPTFEPFFD